MKRFLRLFVLLGSIPLVWTAHEYAWAISTGKDVIGEVTSIIRSPPSNNTLRPTNGVGGNGSIASDLGPGLTESPEQVPIGAFPWIVALTEDRQSPQKGFLCAGVLIAPNWVLTAAHCTQAVTRRWPGESELYVLTNTEALATPGPAVAVTKIVTHPQYDTRTRVNDVALLRIEGNAGNGITPIRLDGPPVTGREGTIAQILGWGVTNATLLQRGSGEHLQLLQAAVVGARCFSPGNYPKLRGAGVFCAESILKFHDTCYRFGGGPVLLHDAAGERYLGGLVSWSAVCPPNSRKPNAYLDVQAYLPWIRSVIGRAAKASP